MSKRGGGYYFDLRQPNIGGRPVYSGYDDFAPPIFVGELIKDQYSLGVGNIPDTQRGASRKMNRVKRRSSKRRRSSRRRRI
jgi:hypothetical protein